MLTLPDPLRSHLRQHDAPVPLVDAEDQTGYVLMPVQFAEAGGGAILARVPGFPAVGLGKDPESCLTALADAIRDDMDWMIDWEDAAA